MAVSFKQLLHRKEEFPALTGVRFLAVTMVFLIHHNSIKKFGIFWGNIFDQLYVGVQVFFVLSGFLICYVYYDKTGWNKKSLVVYFTRRFARVYPLFFIATTIVFVINFIQGNTTHWLAYYFSNITLLKGFSGWYWFTGLFQTWSLTVEETFYVFAPLIFFVIKRKNILFGQVIFFWAAGFLLAFFFSKFPFKGLFLDYHFTAMTTFFGRCFEFFLGIWLALLIRKRPPVNIPSTNWFSPYTYAGLLGMIITILCLSYITPNQKLQPDLYPYMMLLRLIVFPVSVTVFLYGLLKERSLARGILSHPVITLLGRSSYALFLFHTGIYVTWIKLYVTTSVFITFIIVCVFSILVFLFVEEPLRNIINRWGQKIAAKR